MSKIHSSVKGVAALRRLLKQLPDSANLKLVDMLKKAGPVLTANMKAAFSQSGTVDAKVQFAAAAAPSVFALA